MKLSLNWLNKFVDIAHLDPDDVMTKLTLHTAEIEDIEHTGEALGNVVLARIKEKKSLAPGYFLLSLEANPDAQVVCTDETLREGDYVALARPGSVVEGVKIKTAEIQGHQSEGMLLCERELGLSTYDKTCFLIDKKMVTKPEQTGRPITEIFDFFKDILLFVDNKSVTHRPDLWGIYGFARELAAIYRQPLTPLPVTSVETINKAGLPGPDIKVVDTAGCRRYASLFVRGLPQISSPLEMRTLLYYSEVNPINLATDLTNFVMLETGQPMHAFDDEKVRGSIVVDKSDSEAAFEFLDGKERVLPAGSLMINDGSGNPVALAGIMGGELSKIFDSTKDVLLESANFDATTVRLTSTNIKLRTDASARFEKSLVPRLAVLALQRYVHLLSEIAPEASVSQLTDVNHAVETERRLQLSHSFVNNFVGKSLPDTEVSDILSRVGFKNKYNDGTFEVEIPWYRSAKDVSNSADVVEEIARIYGYNNIEPHSPLLKIEPLHRNDLLETEYALKQILSFQYGFNEVRTYAWDDNRWLSKLEHNPGDQVALQNPSSVFNDNLKTSLVPALLQLTEKALADTDVVRIYECESVFCNKTESERKSLAGILCEKKGDEQDLFVTAKDYFQNLFMSLRNRPVEFRAWRGDPVGPWQQTDLTVAAYCSEKYLGYVTILNHRLKNVITKNHPAVVFEFDTEAFTQIGIQPSTYTEPPTFPTVSLDFNVIADKSKNYNDLVEVVNAFQHEYLIEYGFKEVFQDEERLPGKKSFLFAYTIGSSKGTLEAEQISDFQQKFIKHLEERELSLRN